MGIGDNRDKFYHKVEQRNAMFHSGLSRRIEIDELKNYQISDPYAPGNVPPRVEIIPSLPTHSKKRGPGHVGSFCLFGAVKKMPCLTFSLPAGPLRMHGTCPSSNYPAASAAYICNGCYALSGNYLVYPDITRKHMVVAEWTRRAVKAGDFAYWMTQCLTHIQNIPKEMCVTKLKMKDGGYDIRVWSDTHLFRLHDAGDFFNTDYVEQWFAVAAHFNRDLNPDCKKQITFWAPTRTALNPDNTINNHFVGVFRKAPSNMIIRPSSLYFEDPPPSISGLPAGSMVTGQAQAKPIRVCPAYRNKDATCRSAECRYCWSRPETPIAYPVHGADAERLAAAVSGLVAANPAMPEYEEMPDTLL